MGKTAVNLAIVLGLITIGFAGYYLYLQSSASTLNTESGEYTMEAMLARTQQFIQHRQTLDQVSLDFSVLDDLRFTVLRKFSVPIQVQPIGRENPFAEADEPIVGEISTEPAEPIDDI